MCRAEIQYRGCLHTTRGYKEIPCKNKDKNSRPCNKVIGITSESGLCVVCKADQEKNANHSPKAVVKSPSKKHADPRSPKKSSGGDSQFKIGTSPNAKRGSHVTPTKGNKHGHETKKKAGSYGEKVTAAVNSDREFKGKMKDHAIRSSVTTMFAQQPVPDPRTRIKRAKRSVVSAVLAQQPAPGQPIPGVTTIDFAQQPAPGPPILEENTYDNGDEAGYGEAGYDEAGVDETGVGETGVDEAGSAGSGGGENGPEDAEDARKPVSPEKAGKKKKKGGSKKKKSVAAEKFGEVDAFETSRSDIEFRAQMEDRTVRSSVTRLFGEPLAPGSSFPEEDANTSGDEAGGAESEGGESSLQDKRAVPKAPPPSKVGSNAARR